MPVCASCRHHSPDGFQFCGHCGTAFAAPGCDSCGFVNPAGLRFCGGCGRALEPATAPAAPSERTERRIATVMFADVVGFTALAETSDPEPLALRVDAALRAVAEVVASHGGTIDKYLGDALMAVFGVPIAHDDDAARAVAAALQVRRSEGDLQFAVGINSGEVMVTPVGEGGDMTVIGDTVNVAARLQSAAGAGEILVGPLTAELVGTAFDLVARPPTLLKGRSQAVAVFEVIGGAKAAEPGTDTAPLVGRDAELSFLTSSWRRATARSRPQVVLLAAEAGAGKSRLAEALVEEVTGAATIVRTACRGYGALVGSHLAMELGRQLTSGDVSADPLASLDERGVWRLRRLVNERAASGPLLVVIDDMHHAPVADLESLAQLCARLDELPVMVVLAGRPHPGDWLTRFPGASTLHLDALDRGDALTLAEALTGDLPLEPGAARALASQSGGNPLHLRELVRLLRSRGSLVAADGTYRLEDRPMLPPTLQAVLAARLDALGADDKAVLQDVAVFGDGATAGEIAALSQRDPRPSLDRLLDAGLVREQEDRFVVQDALLREVAYEQLSHASRGERHRRAAEVATTDLGRARHLGLAAGYLDDADLRRQAADVLATTGTELLTGLRFRDGVSLMRRAVELGHRQPRTLLRLAQAELDVGQHRRAVELLDIVDAAGDERVLAEVVHARGNAESSMELLDEAMGRWERLGDRGKIAWALANRGLLEFQVGRVTEAAASEEAAMALFAEAGDPEGAAAAGRALALVRPDDPRVPSLLADGLRHAEASGDLALERNALIPIAWSLFLGGQLGGDVYTARALATAARLAQVTDELGDAGFELQAHSICAIIHRLAGRLDEAVDHVERGRAAARRMGDTPQRLVEACAYMAAVARGGDVRPAPPPPAEPHPLELIAEAVVVQSMLYAGAFDVAIQRLEISPVTTIGGQSPFFARLVGTTRGAVLVLADRYDEAADTLRLALQGARTVRAYPNEVAATALLAEVHMCRGEPEAAATLVAAVDTDPGGIAGVLLLRARLLLGDATVTPMLRTLAEQLAAPGLAPADPPLPTTGGDR